MKQLLRAIKCLRLSMIRRIIDTDYFSDVMKKVSLVCLNGFKHY